MKLRLFFDAGSGVCLWAGDERTCEAYGYPIDLDSLPLRRETIEFGNKLIERFDESMNWDDPASSSPWSLMDYDVFSASVAQFQEKIMIELGPTYDVVNELRL